MNKKIVVIFAIPTLLFGCGSFDKRKDNIAKLLNPPRIHGAFNKDSDAYKASVIPVTDYYNALEIARTKYMIKIDINKNKSVTRASKAKEDDIRNYVEEGIGLVNSYCRRWFQFLDDTHRLLTYQNKNVNVISQLGTTLLGIGNANSSIVTGYGAFNTAYAGASENFNSAFLVAPTASKVREHIESAMKDEANRLRKDSNFNNGINFKQVYNRLEQYASLCTHAQAKEIVDSALNLTKTKVNPDTFQIETVKKENGENKVQLPAR